MPLPLPQSSRVVIAAVAAERDRRLIAGDREGAWDAVRRGLAEARGLDEELALLEDSIGIALHYGSGEEASRWLDLVELARSTSGPVARGGPSVRAILRILRSTIEVERGDHRAADVIEKQIDWSAVEGIPWVANFRLFRLLQRGDAQAAFDLLRAARRREPRELRPFDLGNRLRILSAYHLDRGDAHRYRRIAEAAVAHFERDGSLRGRLFAIELRGLLGRTHFNSGENDEALARLEEAVALARAVHHDRYARWFSVELALTRFHAGQPERAREILDGVLLREILSPRDAYHQVRVLQARAEIALDREELEAAEGALREAEELLERHPHGRHRAYLDVLRAEVEAASPAPGTSERALARLERAEAAFRKLGCRGYHGLAKALVTRGHVHLRRREVHRALECCARGMELAVTAGYLPLQARALLLKSCVLAEADLPVAEGIYEDVLRQLGVARDPVVLFRVLANLYLYTWDLEERLDLTFHHLDQIDALQRVIDENLYLELYDRHLTEKVIARVTGDSRRRA